MQDIKYIEMLLPNTTRKYVVGCDGVTKIQDQSDEYGFYIVITRDDNNKVIYCGVPFCKVTAPVSS